MVVDEDDIFYCLHAQDTRLYKPDESTKVKTTPNQPIQYWYPVWYGMKYGNAAREVRATGRPALPVGIRRVLDPGCKWQDDGWCQRA